MPKQNSLKKGNDMKSLLIYLKDYKKESVLAPIFKMLEACFELIVPLVMAAVIDVGIVNSDKTYVMKMCGVLVLLGIVGLAASITAQFFAAKAATGFASKLRFALFEHIHSLSFSQTDVFGTDTLITRMTSDINQVQSGVNMVLRLFMRSPIVVIGAMIMAFTVNPSEAFIFVIVIPLLAIVVFGIMLITMPLYKKAQARLDLITRGTRENLTGVRVIRAFNKEESEEKNYFENTKALSKEQQFVGGISGLMNPITYLMISFATIALIYSGAVKVDTGILTKGQVIALINYMSQILIELVKLANLIILTTKAVACGDRIAAVLNTKPDMVNGKEEVINTDNNEVLSFDHVSLTYKGGQGKALDDITFTIQKGQTVGIIGGTGSGKSSLVNLIPRFYDATEGKVSIFGRDVREYNYNLLRDKIGIVLQKAELFHGTIEENLKWGKENASKDDIEKALEYSQAKEYVDKKPGKTSFEIEQNGRNLSGGQKQRLTIARALIKKPDILIMDDSASALDFATDAKLRMSIRNMSKDITTFIVSQRAASVQYADVILVMDDGKLVGKGTHEELLAQNKVYQEIYYSQFPKEEAVNG